MTQVSATTKLVTKQGLHTFERPMTRAQAERYGNRVMPKDLKRAGFQTVICETDVDLHGWHGFRINYGRKF